MELRFAPTERRSIVLEILKGSPHGLSIKDITRQLKERGFDISDKTSQRIIDMLIASNYPIEIREDESRGKGRFYSLPTHYKPDTVVNLNPSEIEAVYVALGLMNPLKNTHYFRELTSLSARLEAMIPKNSRNRIRQLREEMAFGDRSFMISDVNDAILSSVRAGISESHYLEALYFSAYKGKAEKKILGPEKIFLYNGNTYLIATDRGMPKTFVLHRFQSVKLIADKPYEKMNIEPADLFKNSIGINSTGEVDWVRLRFTKGFTPYIRERSFHETQKLKVNEDGSTTLSMKLAMNEELVNWILSWGTNVSVLAPTSLADQVKDTAKRIHLGK